MKTTMIAIAAATALAAYTAPAFAAGEPTFTGCDASATQKGVEWTAEASYKAFMVDCLADPAPPGASRQTEAQRVAQTWQTCEDLAISRGVITHERRSTESPSAWKQFMDACLAGRVAR